MAAVSPSGPPVSLWRLCDRLVPISGSCLEELQVLDTPQGQVEPGSVCSCGLDEDRGREQEGE